ncbi:uncharacterized protein LOC134854012 isoform X2 [Symsagittifera roscoffensis]|uniref:uncharacterized protein LOC134854012 isoform X2 n=1 Tax=Symsagittifera roscoffensis TaxID=84072 RepID=UPI00307BE155
MRMKVGGGGHILEVNETLATLSGLMEGTATIGAAISQWAVALLRNGGNWFGITIFLLIIMLSCVVVTVVPTYEDMRRLWARYQEKKEMLSCVVVTVVPTYEDMRRLWARYQEKKEMLSCVVVTVVPTYEDMRRLWARYQEKKEVNEDMDDTD